MRHILFSVVDNIKLVLQHQETAADMWNYLKRYNVTGASSLDEIQHILGFLKLSSCNNNMDLLITRANEQFNKLEQIGEPVSMRWRVTNFLRMCDSPKLLNWVDNQRFALRKTSLDIEDVTAEAMEEWRSKSYAKLKDVAAIEPAATNFVAQKPKYGKKPKQFTGAPTPPRFIDPNASCWAHPDLFHKNKECYKQHPELDKRKALAAPAIKSIEDKIAGFSAIVTSSFTATATATTGYNAVTATDPPVISMFSSTSLPTAWIVDSGASDHMSNDLSLFIKNETRKINVEITTANGITFATYIGNIRIDVRQSDGNYHELILRNALYVPTLCTNLVSLKKLARVGGIFDMTNLALIRGSQELSKVVETSFGWVLQWRKPFLPTSVSSCYSDLSQTSHVAATSIALVSRTTWHRRLGHPAFPKLDKIADNVTGMVITDSETVNSENPPSQCQICHLSKAHRHVSKKPTTRYKLGQRWDVDAVGPINPQSISGMKYYFNAKENASRMNLGYVIKDQINAWKALIGHILHHEELWEVRCIFIRLDGHLSVYNKNFTDWCNSRGTVLEVTPAHTGEMNGNIERSNGYIIMVARCILTEALLPKSFWSMAVIAAAYLANRTTSRSFSPPITPLGRALDLLHPLEGVPHRPDVSHLRVYGCRCYVTVQKEDRVQSDKLSPRGQLGKLVGYKGNSLYVVYLPPGSATRVNGGLVETSHVTFDESIIDDWRTVPWAERIEDVTNVEEYDTGSLPAQFAPVDGYNDVVDQSLGEIEFSLGEIEVDASLGIQQQQQQVVVTEEPNLLSDLRQLGSNSDTTPSLPDATNSPNLGPSPTADFSGEQVSTEVNELNDDDSESNSDIGNVYNNTQTPWEISSNVQITRRHRRDPVIAAYISTINNLNASPGPDDPKTIEEARASATWPYWAKAQLEEMNSIRSHGVWAKAKLPPGVRALKGKWVFKTKYNLKGLVEKYKARWVIKGFLQKEGVDFFETFASVVRSTTYKLIFALVALRDLECHQIDVETAFLYGLLNEVIYMETPPGFEQEFGPHVRLSKTLYGLKQSPHYWYETLRKALEAMGFSRTQSDNCMFIRGDVWVLVYVDDMLITAPTVKQVNQVKVDLAKSFKIKDLGEAGHFLALEITRDRENRTITLSQKGYIEKILNRFHLNDSTPCSTPMRRPHGLLPHDGTVDLAVQKIYRSEIGSLMHAFVQTRWDIGYAMSVLSRHLANPTVKHSGAAKEVLRYLRGTSDKPLTFKFGPKAKTTVLIAQQELNLTAYSDSDWGGDISSSRSTAGYIILANGTPISWRSGLQSTVALSSCEAEYYALTDAIKDILWIQSLLTEIKYTGTDLAPMRLYEDNQSAIVLAENPEFHKRSKHIRIRYHWVREQVADGTVVLFYCPTAEMAADGLTKPLSPAKHKEWLHTVTNN